MASPLYNYFLNCWKNCGCTQQQLQNAVAKGYITQQEYDQIIATPQNCTAMAAENPESGQ